MKKFDKYIDEKKKSKSFRKAFSEEKAFAELAVKLALARKDKNLTQVDLSKRAGVTQQQISKIERGENCETITLIKVCQALDLKLDAVGS